MPSPGLLALALLDGTTSGLLLALTVVGFSFSFGILRIVNVAHGEFFMLGAVLAWAVVTATGSFPLALVLAPAAVMALAVAVDRLVLRPLRYAAQPTVVATLGVLYVLQQLTLLLYGPEARGVAAPFGATVEFPWFGYSGYKLAVAGLSAALLAGLGVLLRRTDLGLMMRATRQDPEMAVALGVPVERVYTTAFALGAGMAAVAGVLVVPVQQAHYLMGLDVLLLSFVVVILGGLGSLGGTVAASLLVGWMDSLVSLFFTPTLARVFTILVVALVLVVRRGGPWAERAE
ncbi:MAG: branched-chain amino acid ABC transporter permease [Armatimonadota bacterium]|nr:branched-chain amino acid ABC transporter permease [Armatimonadota bacterium]MDR7439946.1 branched-chain amino acid ABC transporter permease [Armatimonadota bacterium]MDR7562726.1 branched-chain amino acid ABC transporter permease [Armatimonadota bacterium]MDR7567943.1 branched-chain amino acid ABC transporter permease [Armatimonadota bacterium]MDR7601025.1 branched-chain amino acid ABC transporter permease [Armatimonadota bacterium]